MLIVWLLHRIVAYMTYVHQQFCIPPVTFTFARHVNMPMIIYLVTGEGWITPISKKERKQNKQSAGQKEVTSRGPARLSPRPYKMTASWDSAQSSPKATEQAAVGESNMTAEVGVAKQKQQEIESERNGNEEVIR